MTANEKFVTLLQRIEDRFPSTLLGAAPGVATQERPHSRITAKQANRLGLLGVPL